MAENTRTTSRSHPKAKGMRSRALPRPVTREEAGLWADAMAGVKPLRARNKERVKPPRAPAETSVEASAEASSAHKPAAAHRPEAAGPRPRDLLEPLPELGPDAAPGLDKRTARRLKRGQLAIEARIDLHGLTRKQAHRALEGFLQSAHDAGKRCALVITGKGLSPSGEPGALRSDVPRWLNAPPIRPRVLAFCPASPRDGGAGALYVLLRRKR